MSRTSDMTLARFDASKMENQKLAAALGLESERLTALMEDSNALLTILTSDVGRDLPPIVRMAVTGFLRKHPEVAPKRPLPHED